ncbi:MAG: DUF1287 domain-containing protein [Caulobacteraceae bacterium]|nr:MAG: DUF1287 domain-containing protein [Caulobacteraceae bacterium]
MFDRRVLLIAGPALLLPAMARAAPADWGERLVAAARSQIGKTTLYDPAYVRLAYPGGDVPLDRGVCSDVVIRAYRTAFGFDLQAAVHRDMAANFGAYPRTWGLRGPDRNIDHRRVPNLEVYLRRQGARLPPETPWKAGDLITQRLMPGSLPHILIATGRRTATGEEIIVENIGAGAQLGTPRAMAQLTGHFRLPPA